MRNELEEAERKFQGICPFCGEDDFDLVGLKNHFECGWCHIYELTPSISRTLYRKEGTTNAS